MLIGVGSALTSVFEYAQWQPDPFLRLVLILAMFTLTQKLLSVLPKTPVYYAIVSFLCVWLAVQTAPSVKAFLSGFTFLLGVYFVGFIAVKQLVLSLMSLALEQTVDVNGLKVGMIPAEQIVWLTHTDGSIRYEKEQVEFSSGRGDNIVISPDPEGLTVEEISKLQHLAKQGAFNKFENQIKIQPSIRFAPIISVGVLLTILCQGPFYLKLTQLF